MSFVVALTIVLCSKFGSTWSNSLGYRAWRIDDRHSGYRFILLVDADYVWGQPLVEGEAPEVRTT